MAKARLNTEGNRRLAGRALASYVRLVRNTSSLTVDPPDGIDRAVANVPEILAMWHGQFLLLPSVHPNDRLTTESMVARHGDADVIGHVLDAFGMPTIRGAGAGGRRKDRGGAAALRGALKAIENGHNVALTADVPPGPARKAGMGIVTLARLSGRPVRPVAIASSRFRTFDTWSRMTLNLPYSRIAFVLGEPILAARDADEHTQEVTRLAIETELNRVTARAYEIVGADLERATPDDALPTGAAPAKLGWRLSTYRALTGGLSPLAPAVLRYRQRRGKEDANRIGERLGHAGEERPAGQFVWFHAASVGETNAVLPIIAALRNKRPGINVLLTTGTATSAEMAAKRLPPGAIHQFVPIDTPAAVSRFLKHWKPDLGVLAESELWPNVIIETERAGIPLALVNARMSSKSFSRWRRNRRLARQLMSRFRMVLAQNNQLARRFRLLGARDSRACGNVKIDAPPLPFDINERQALSDAIGARPLFAACSTHPGEDEAVLAAHHLLLADHPRLLTIIVPRHPVRGDSIAEAATVSGLKVARRSIGTKPFADTDIYIADTIGELGIIYGIAPAAFIGGSLIPHGGQNPIEAIRHDCAVITGPHWANFSDSYKALIAEGGAIEVRSPEELATAADKLMSNPLELERSRRGAQNALEQLSGALERTVEALLEVLPPDEGMRRAS